MRFRQAPLLALDLNWYQISESALNFLQEGRYPVLWKFSLIALLGFWFLKVMVHKQATYPKSQG